MELTEFLLARIAEIEAHHRPFADRATPPYDQPHRRWLAECAAKREIVTDFRRWDLLARKSHDMSAMGTASGLRVACLRLALIFEDHPDFDPIWRP